MESLHSIDWRLVFSLGFIGGMLWGFCLARSYFKENLKVIASEYDDQYTTLLKQHGIPIKKEY